MKPVVKKVLESGLVSKHTAKLMEKWGSLDRGASSLVDSEVVQKTEQALADFAEELDELVSREREKIQETKLCINIGNPVLVTWVLVDVGGKNYDALTKTRKIPVFRDEMGNFLFPTTEEPFISEGNKFEETSSGKVHEIKEFVPLYMGEYPYGIQVTV